MVIYISNLIHYPTAHHPHHHIFPEVLSTACVFYSLISLVQSTQSRTYD
jgi:hypothetical protein